ncbi:hypothetical protein ZEAMMB73_Zm00001d039539 [Zea mays]|uniref:Uncharacterized protein n=1 Tax=Zea mays TaxID=4577 RepID=A0A1D6MI94_MAIZE|nr:hypothetical protein ZEAMMB73_Zm00001d039539 [Zea mays]
MRFGLPTVNVSMLICHRWQMAMRRTLMKNSLVLQMSPLATCRISHWRVSLLANGANCLMIFFFEHLPPGLDKGKVKATRQSKCGVCGEYGHRTGSAKCRYTGAKTRKRCRKVNAKQVENASTTPDDLQLHEGTNESQEWAQFASSSGKKLTPRRKPIVQVEHDTKSGERRPSDGDTFEELHARTASGGQNC